MSIPKKVLNYLEKNKIKYEEVAHKTVYTAFDLANTLKEKLQNIAKTLVIKADGKHYLIVIPAHYRLDIDKLKKHINAKKVEICRENAVSRFFKVKPGAITPFGTLHKVDVVVDKALLKVQKAIFRAGSFNKSLRLKVKDFIRLEEAKLASLGKSAGYKLQKKKGASRKKAKKSISLKKKSYSKKSARS